MNGPERPPEVDGPARIDRVPEELQQALLNADRPCGDGRFAWVWGQGEAKGKQISVYCAEPLCLQTDPMRCTGPRFVPHMNQTEEGATPREITEPEAILASRAGAELARRQTGRPDERSDKEIGYHIAKVWSRAKAALEGGI